MAEDKKIPRDFSNTGRDSTFPEKWEAAFNEFECFREEVRKLDGDILLMAEIVRIRRVQSAKVRELIDARDFGGFLEFLERLE